MVDNGALFAKHSRQFHDNRFVYPVWSRRSNGLSIGINLNPDKVCNFGCIYCQVDRRVESDTTFVDLPRLLRELDEMLESVRQGSIWELDEFRSIPLISRRVNDMAFSGDGEPTTFRNFDEIITLCADRKRFFGLDDLKMVLITNASMFHRPQVARGLAVLDDNQGEIWAKLDAGTESYYQLVDRTKIPFQLVIDNILLAARCRPIVIQSLFMQVNGEPPSSDELMAYCDRLREISQQGGKVKLVQIYTIARRPAESWVTPLSDLAVNAIVDRVRESTGLPAQPYYSSYHSDNVLISGEQ